MFYPFFDIITYIGLLFLLSQACGRIAIYLKAPALVGYLLAGILFGPSLLNLFSKKLIDEQLTIITDITLSIIAFSIGGTLKLTKTKKAKGAILWITFLQAFAVAIIVFLFSSFIIPLIWKTKEASNGFQKSYLPIALILGAISVATAPGAILSIIHEYKAKGKFTSTLLGIITLDDALALIFYSFAIVMSSNLLLGKKIALITGLVTPLTSIVLAIVLGVIIGWVIKKIITYFGKKDVLLGLIIGAILLTSGIATTFGFSPLLANMTLGFIVVNFVEHLRAEETFRVIESIEEPIFGIFFLLAGAQLKLHFAANASLLAVLLLLTRFSGKLLGTYVGSVLSSAEKPIRRYMGLSLLPTAGVTIGLVLEANAIFGSVLPQLSILMVNGIIGATLLNEIISPFLVRFSLKQAGEIK